MDTFQSKTWRNGTVGTDEPAITAIIGTHGTIYVAVDVELVSYMTVKFDCMLDLSELFAEDADGIGHILSCLSSHVFLGD